MTGLRLYDTLSGRCEPFVPAGDPVGVYVCGITPYDSTHLGHAFTYVMIDVLLRTLEHAGLKVRYVQNLTDIDDAILRAAKARGTDWRELGLAWTARYVEDMQALNVRPPDRFPLATETIDAAIEVVSRLLARGHAYVREGHVYFAVGSCSGFGGLSRLSRGEMLAVARDRGEDPDDPRKRDALDFLLWQARKPGEPAWDSPWGRGRPGWHVECSTMAERELGGTVDIHGGGGDLVYPHHECEIAQSECATGRRPFARTWFHTAMVHHEGRKMSKRLGNLVMVRDLLAEVSPDALRLYLLSHHYRETWEFDRSDLLAARPLERQLRAVLDAPVASGTSGWDAAPHRAAFLEALDDDLGTPAALAVLSRLADEVLVPDRGGRVPPDAAGLLRELADVLGLMLTRQGPSPEIVRGWEVHLRRVRSAHARPAPEGGASA